MMELNKYELARLISARASQLFFGAPPLIKVSSDDTYISIAERELEQGVLPLSIKSD
jgi:DNA-directed RNA polymerase subunit K